MGVYFVGCHCTHCVICLLREGRSGAGQCDQDIRLTATVGNKKEKIRIQIEESVRIVNYTLNTSLIASLMPSKAAPDSTTAKFSYH